MGTQDPKYPVQTLEKAFEILELLSQEGYGHAGISELSRASGMGKSTVHRILDTLVARGYVDKVPGSSSYRLSWKLYELGNTVPQQRNIGNFDMQILNDLCTKYQETINLAVRSYNSVVVISKVEPQTALKANIFIGSHEPLHVTALGKALISDMDPEEIRSLLYPEDLKAYTPMSITNINDLIVEIYKVREQGFAIDNQEFCLGLTCMAMPIRNFNEEIIAAISISSPSVRFDFNKILEMKEGLLSATQLFSRHLGYSK